MIQSVHDRGTEDNVIIRLPKITSEKIMLFCEVRKKCYSISENVSFSVKSARTTSTDWCRVWTCIICSLSTCPCTFSMGPWVTLKPLASGSPYFHPNVTPSRLGQLSRNLTSSRSRSCRTSQHCWLPQKLETYFPAFKVWNQDVKISASHSSSSGKKPTQDSREPQKLLHSWCGIQSHLWQGTSSPKSSGTINWSCQWLTWVRWGSLNWPKLLWTAEKLLEKDQESLGESCLHFLMKYRPNVSSTMSIWNTCSTGNLKIS